MLFSRCTSRVSLDPDQHLQHCSHHSQEENHLGEEEAGDHLMVPGELLEEPVAVAGQLADNTGSIERNSRNLRTLHTDLR